MDEALKLAQIRSLLENLDCVEVLATEAALMAQDAERDGHLDAAQVFWNIAHSQRAKLIQYQAQYDAFGIIEITDEKGRS